jgi:hypothetical protein
LIWHDCQSACAHPDLLGKGVQRMSLNRSSSAGGTTGAADRAAERASHNEATSDNGTKA